MSPIWPFSAALHSARQGRLSLGSRLRETKGRSEKEVQEEQQYEQMNLFTDFGIAKKEKEEKNEKLEREKKMQKAMLDIKKKYGKNAILKGMNLQEDGTAMERNRQIGGHKA